MAQLAKLSYGAIPASVFQQLPWWDRLSAEDQKQVERDSQNLARAQFHQGASKLEMGKYLVALRDRLDRYGVFVRHLKNFRMSQRTAYRYIDAYSNAKKRFPDPVLAVILARGLDMLGDTPECPYGKYTPVMRALPPPKTRNTTEIAEWADKVEAKYRDYRGKLNAGEILSHANPSFDESLKEAFRAVRIRLRRLPANKKAKFVSELSGMLLAEIGVSGNQNVEAMAVPEDFKQGRGRPRLVA
jgi:hypothetical protein